MATIRGVRDDGAGGRHACGQDCVVFRPAQGKFKQHRCVAMRSGTKIIRSGNYLPGTVPRLIRRLTTCVMFTENMKTMIGTGHTLACFSTFEMEQLDQMASAKQTGLEKRVRTEVETIDALLAHYASGLLPEPARVIVEAHLEIKAANRPLVSVFDEVGGDMLMSGPEAQITRRDERLNAIFSAEPIAVSAARDKAPVLVDMGGGEQILMPKAIREFVGYDADRIPWRSKLPGFKEHIVGEIDGFEVSFFWIRPGRAVPAHTHHGCELSIVLDGAFNDARGRFGRGDISLADDSVDHRPVAESQRPCFGFAVVDAPLKLTGSLRQLIGDLIG